MALRSSALLLSDLDRFPIRIRVVLLHLRNDFGCFGPQVFLEDLALMIDDEGHNAGGAILGGKCHQCEAGNHVAVDDIVIFATGNVATLPGKDAVVIAVVGRATVLKIKLIFHG